MRKPQLQPAAPSTPLAAADLKPVAAGTKVNRPQWISYLAFAAGRLARLPTMKRDARMRLINVGSQRISWGDVSGAGGEDYADVGRSRRLPGDAVGMDDLHHRPAGPIKVGSRVPRNLLVDVDAHHVYVGPGEVGRAAQRSVLPGADLEYPITGSHGHLFEQCDHDRGSRRGTEGSSVPVP